MNTQQLRDLEQAATPGPWEARPLQVGDVGDDYDLVSDYDGVPWDIGELNYPFIAAMRNALPHLLNIAEAAREARAAGRQRGYIADDLAGPVELLVPCQLLLKLDDALARFEQA